MIEPPTLVVIGLLVGSIVIGAVFWHQVLNRRWSGQADATRLTTLSSLGGQFLTSSPQDRDIEQRIVDPRIYVFVSEHPGHSRQLLAVAAALKYRHAHEPIHLCVDADERSAGGKPRDNLTNRTLSRTVQKVATPASVSTQIVTDHLRPSSIVDQVCEKSADVVLIDWEEPCQNEDIVINEMVDQLLDRTRLPIYAVYTNAEEIAIPRLHLVLPREIDHYEGFYEALYNVKQIAGMYGAEVVTYVFEGSVHQYRQLFDLVEIDVSVEFVRANNWKDATRKVEETAEPDDLVVALAVREEGLGWDGGFSELSYRIRSGAAQSAAVFFLRQDDPGRDDHFLRV